MNARYSLWLAVVAACSAAALTTPVEAGIFNRKKPAKQAAANTVATANKDSLEFEKKLADTRRFDGMINAYLDKKGQLMLEIPDSALSSTYLLASRINSISDTGDLVAGQMNITPLVVRFSRDDYNVYLHLVQDGAVVDPNDPISSSFERNFTDPVAKGFPIKLRRANSTVIDVTDFFKGDERLISPIKDADPLAILLSGRQGITANHYADGSAVTKVKCFPDNILIESRLTYTTPKVTKPYTATVARSLIRLPENPMRSRIQDNRVGYFYDMKELYSSNLDGTKKYGIINRFRLEPKNDDDLQAYIRGELIEPKQKIIFYVDPAFPAKWRPAVKEGIEYWNTAFEAAGFKNVIQALDYPENDPSFDPDDVRRNCVRYCVTPTANAMGPSYVDPRTGEILGADVIWYHNVLQLVHNWRFAQTAAVDPRVRTHTFDDAVMHESLTYVTAHEIGHCLGLMHNMGASHAYTLENLRDPEFTQQYGTTPSIMDYARNNFVAQPGDLERGVRLTPPPVGVYDIHAIEWGYRLIPGADTPEAEKPYLNQWIRRHDGDPMYEFGAQQVFGTIDPSDQTEDLGNDHIAAGEMAIDNLRIIMANIEDWAGTPNEDYNDFVHTYKALVSQYARHIAHVYPYIGGVVFKEVRQANNDGDARNFVPKEQQKRAMQWLLSQTRTCGWMTPERLMSQFDEPYEWRPKMERNLVGCLLSPTAMGRIKAGYVRNPQTGYKIQDYINDVITGIFDAAYHNRPLNDTERNLQCTAVAVMIKQSGLKEIQGTAPTKALTAVDEFAQTSLQLTAPAICCSHDIHSAVSAQWAKGNINTLTQEEITEALLRNAEENQNGDAARSFFRIVLGETPLPTIELQAMMTGQLQKILKLSKKCSTTGADEATRQFYDYQARLIEAALASPKAANEYINASETSRTPTP